MKPSRDRAEEEGRVLGAVLELARRCEYDEIHTHHVTHLSLRLFDELAPLHHLGARERLWLQCGALLHDIGWVEGQQKHHKTALRIILNTPMLPFDARERYVVGAIARYHRKALPDVEHGHFAALAPADRDLVGRLAGILRVADGLDRTHASVVEDLSCELSPAKIVLRCRAHAPAEPEREVALAKGKLLEQAFGRRLSIEMVAA